MILHLVTALNRLTTADPRSAEARSCLVRQIHEAIHAGVDVVQIREPALDAGALTSIVLDAVDRARGTLTRIVVNDRLDVALACGAGGVHLKEDSVRTEAVRRIVPSGFLVGRSVHTVSEAQNAGPVDYLIAGTVWPTPSKPRDAHLLGTEGLATLVASVDVPVLAIGGVTHERLPLVAAAGAVGAAGIELFLGPESGPEGCRAVPLAERVAALRAIV